MSNRTASLRASVAAVAAALAATAAALDPKQFVAGWPIEAPADAEVFDVPLTAEVYAAADEHRAARGARCQRRAAVVLSPRPAAGRADRAARRARSVAAVRRRRGGAPERRCHDERGAARRSRSRPARRARPRSSGFVLDARAVETAPVALELDWRALPQPFLLDVGIEQSTDLTNWRSVGASVRRGARDRRRRGAARARAGARERRRLLPRHVARRRRRLAPAARDARQRRGRARRRRRASACRRSPRARGPRTRPPTRCTSTPAARCP